MDAYSFEIIIKPFAWLISKLIEHDVKSVGFWSSLSIIIVLIIGIIALIIFIINKYKKPEMKVPTTLSNKCPVGYIYDLATGKCVEDKKSSPSVSSPKN